MDIEKELLHGFSKANLLKIVRYIGAHQSRFNKLINNYLKGPYRTTQRAAWVITVCIQEHPHLLKSHIGNLLNNIENDDTPLALKRNTMRLLQFAEIPQKHNEQVVNLGFRFLQSRKEPVAVKVFSMSVLAKIVHTMPELQTELRIIIEDQLAFSSAAFRSRAKKVLPMLK